MVAEPALGKCAEIADERAVDVLTRPDRRRRAHKRGAFRQRVREADGGGRRRAGVRDGERVGERGADRDGRRRGHCRDGDVRRGPDGADRDGHGLVVDDADRRLEARGEGVGARRGGRARDRAGGGVDGQARGHGPAGDGPGARQTRGQRGRIAAARRAARHRGTGGEHAGGRGLRDAQVGLGGVHGLRDRDGRDALGGAERDRIGLDRVEDAQRDARRLPGRDGNREVLEVRVLEVGVGQLAGGHEPGVGNIGQEDRLRLFQERTAQRGRGLVDLVREELALEAGRELAIEREPDGVARPPCCPCS